MVKFWLQLLVVGLLVFFVGEFVPYWTLMIIVAVLGFFLGKNAVVSFFSSGLGFGLAWIAAILMVTTETDSNLPAQMASLMGLKSEKLLWLATGVLGFLMGGFSGMTGFLLKNMFVRKDKGKYWG